MRTTVGTNQPVAAAEAWELMRELVLNNDRRREVSEALGMSFARAKTLRRIAESPTPMGELATHVGIDAPYMTLVVDDLEEQGLATRKPHPRDRRAKLVEATKSGKQAARRANAILDRPPAELADLPEEELHGLVRALRAAQAVGPLEDSSEDSAPAR
jgi:DNA-binding MarR family transcriptional regulator